MESLQGRGPKAAPCIHRANNRWRYFSVTTKGPNVWPDACVFTVTE